MGTNAKKVRLDLKPGTLPPLTSIICGYYQALCLEKGLKHLSVCIDGIVPKSLNSQYVKKFRRRGQKYDLHPAIKELRDMTTAALGYRKNEWRPSGVTAAVVVFETPLWLTKENNVRKMDSDNKVKALFDAIQNATDVPDELHWQFHVFKLASKRTRTIVYLYDLGDVVEYYI